MAEMIIPVPDGYTVKEDCCEVPGLQEATELWAKHFALAGMEKY